MTRIFSSNSSPSDWMVSPFIEKDSDKISRTAPAINESQIVEARNEMERCKASGQTFYYGEDTPDSVKGQLREYAEAIGMNNIQSVCQERIEKSRMSESIRKASDGNDKKADVEMIFDIMPEVTDQSIFKKDESWKSLENSRARELSEKPSGEGIAAIRGGEKYEADPVKRIRPGENSIDAPDAIESLANSKQKTSVDEIRAQNEMRRSKTVFNRDDWQHQKETEMTDSVIIPQAGKRMVESPHSQNQSWSSPGAMSIDGAVNDIPEKTSGEQISDLNKIRLAEISREKQDDDWERMESSVAEKVSEIFIDNLEKNLSKLK